MENETKTKEIGPLAGVVIIIILLVAGGWYFIGNRAEKMQNQKEAGKVLEVSTGSSTEVADIQADLDNLDMNVLNQ